MFENPFAEKSSVAEHSSVATNSHGSEKSRVGKKSQSASPKKEAMPIFVDLVGQLKKIVVCAQSNPDPTIDPVSSLDALNEGHERTRLEELVKKSRTYVATID